MADYDFPNVGVYRLGAEHEYLELNDVQTQKLWS